MPSEAVRAALAEFPAGESRFDRPCARIVRGLVPGTDGGSDAKTSAEIRAWLQARCEAATTLAPSVRKQIASSLDDLVKLAEQAAPEAVEGWRQIIDRLRG